MRIKAQVAPRQCGLAVMAFAEVYWFGHDHDPDRLLRNNHQHCARCRAISAIRFGVVLSGKRIKTAPEMISTPSWGT